MLSLAKRSNSNVHVLPARDDKILSSFLYSCLLFLYLLADAFEE
jgi:hypothetical protein